MMAGLLPSDLSSCDREVLHTPGSIQPHGMMLVAELDGLLVRHAAGDVEQRLQIPEWHGLPLSALVGDVLGGRIAALAEQVALGGFVGQLQARDGELLDVSTYGDEAHVVVELEPASTEGHPPSLMLNQLEAAATGFERCKSLKTLGERAASEFRRLTGYDRVMVYQFLDDAGGRVLAEDRQPSSHSFLNQHFPASDIPRQARALYLRNLVRVIPDVSYQAAPLRPEWTAEVPLDMSDSSLRSVSPTHLKYLANMGVGASASFSIVKDGVLWGMIACHHEHPRSLTYDVRAACRSLGGSLARQIKAMDEAEGYRQRIRLRGFEDDIVVLLSRDGTLDEALSNHLNEIGRMMDGDGVAVLRGRELVRHGICPDEAEIRALSAWLLTRRGGPVWASTRLSSLYPDATEFEVSGSGVLAVILSEVEPWMLLWFRAEYIETVSWAGNPHKDTGPDPLTPLTPRASFAAWAETVRGQARAWSVPEVDAATRLRAAVLEVQQNRRVRDLNTQLTKILLDKDTLLQQKEFLIGEVNHRVQNSLQLVSSFLALQGRASSNPELQAELEEARRRLTAVALVHRRLYRGDQIETVDAARYIEDLCADTVSFMGPDWARHLSLHLAPVLLSTDRAVTLGLILTELVINANKYAYGGAAGPIDIELGEDRTHMHLIVADKGSGRISGRKGFGSRIMESLVAHLGGTLAYTDNQPGLRTEVTIPIQAGSVGRP